MELILKALVPIAVIISLGYFAGWHKIIDSKRGTDFASYVLNFSFPALLFVKIATSKVEDLINYRFIFGFAVGLLGMYAVMFIMNRYIYKRSISYSSQASFICSFPNMAFMGIPVFMVLFGEQSLIAIVIGNIITSLIMIPVTVAILEFTQDTEVKTNFKDMIKKVLTKPLILAPIFGFIVSLLNLKVNPLAVDSLKMIGNTTSSVALFTLGLIMSAQKVQLSRYVFANIFCKNVIHPLIMFCVVLVFGISGDWAKEAILLCAMPSAVTATMFAVKYDVLQVESSSSAVIGTALSLFSAALAIKMLGI